MQILSIIIILYIVIIIIAIILVITIIIIMYNAPGHLFDGLARLEQLQGDWAHRSSLAPHGRLCVCEHFVRHNHHVCHHRCYWSPVCEHFVIIIIVIIVAIIRFSAFEV